MLHKVHYSFSYLIHSKTPFVDPMTCAGPEQHRIKVSYHGTYRHPHQRMETARRAVFYFFSILNVTAWHMLGFPWLRAWAYDLGFKICLGAPWAYFSEGLSTKLKSLGAELWNYKYYLVMDTVKIYLKLCTPSFLIFHLNLSQLYQVKSTYLNLAQFAVSSGHCSHQRGDVLNKNSQGTPRQ